MPDVYVQYAAALPTGAVWYSHAHAPSLVDTHGQGSADAVIADEIQHQEGLIASVPLRDEWGGDKDVYRFSEMEAETPIRPSMPSPLGVGGTPMVRSSLFAVC